MADSTNTKDTPSFASQLLEDIEEYDSSASLYTYEQEKVLFWAGKITTVIGMLGSAYVCYCIAKDPVRRRQTFRRLLFCTSAGHIVLCVLMALLTIPMPRGTHYAAVGNDQSCQAVGFLTHVAFGYTLFYHGAMGAYYIFTFFLGWTERKFHETVEPILHGIAVGVPLLGAIIGICTGLYGPNELLLSCWVETGAPYRVVFIFLAGLIELNYFTIFKQMSLVGIAFTVYKQERRMVLRYSHGASSSPPQSVLMARETLIQASLFFLSCFIPYALMMIMRYYDLFWKKIPADGKVPHYLFGLAVAAQVLYPLQGFFTMIGFVRPDFRKIQKEIPPEQCEEDGSCHFWQCFKATILYQLEANSTPASAVASVRKSRTANVEGSSRRYSTMLSIIRREHPPMDEKDMEANVFSAGTVEESTTNHHSSSTPEETTHKDTTSSKGRSYPQGEPSGATSTSSSSFSGPSRPKSTRVSFAALAEDGPDIEPFERFHDDDHGDDVYDEELSLEEHIETSVRV